MSLRGEHPPLRGQLKMHGWICRRCSNGDHKNCELEQRGLYCTCQEGDCMEP